MAQKIIVSVTNTRIGALVLDEMRNAISRLDPNIDQNYGSTALQKLRTQFLPQTARAALKWGG